MFSSVKWSCQYLGQGFGVNSPHNLGLAPSNRTLRKTEQEGRGWWLISLVVIVTLTLVNIIGLRSLPGLAPGCSSGGGSANAHHTPPLPGEAARSLSYSRHTARLWATGSALNRHHCIHSRTRSPTHPPCSQQAVPQPLRTRARREEPSVQPPSGRATCRALGARLGLTPAAQVVLPVMSTLQQRRPRRRITCPWSSRLGFEHRKPPLSFSPTLSSW